MSVLSGEELDLRFGTAEFNRLSADFTKCNNAACMHVLLSTKQSMIYRTIELSFLAYILCHLQTAELCGAGSEERGCVSLARAGGWRGRRLLS